MVDKTTPQLGSLVDASAQRDAIHIAVAPVIAAQRLVAGEHVGLSSDGRATPNAPWVGIIDPYLTQAVLGGQRCWLFLYPQTITSLRHEWTHPAFQAVAEGARQWIEHYAAQCGQTYHGMMAAAAQWIRDEEYTFDNTEAYKRSPYAAQIGEFWRHYERVTGTTVADHRATFFTCTC